MAFPEGHQRDEKAAAAALAGAPSKRRVREWLWKNRSSARLAYLLILGVRVLTSIANLFWIRLLVDAMGQELYSVYLAFQKVISLGGLGDLGLGGIIGIRSGEYLGQGKETELRKFLAVARSVFLLLALAVGGGFLLISPWLPGWLKYQETAGAGSLPLLFAVGAFPIACVLLSSYLNNLNYGCRNITWPVLPPFILLQLTMLGHWWLARRHEPLYIQYLPYAFNAAAVVLLARLYLRASHPALAEIFPLKFDWRAAAPLLESSFWLYLSALGNQIYRSTDSQVINAGFAPGTLAPYDNNYKFCEIAIFLALVASYVSLPKITQWLASPDLADQQRARAEMRRLNHFQILLGCGAALAYLCGNNLFMKLWWFHDAHPIPAAGLALQTVFALNVAVSASGDAGIQLTLRAGKPGIRFAGILVLGTGLLNLGLSILAMKLHSLWGIAMATVVAQSIYTIAAGLYSCRHFEMPWLPWALRGWLLPVLAIGVGAWLKTQWPSASLPGILGLAAVYGAMFVAAAWGLGITPKFLREELKIVKKTFRK